MATAMPSVMPSPITATAVITATANSCRRMQQQPPEAVHVHQFDADQEHHGGQRGGRQVTERPGGGQTGRPRPARWW